MSSVRNRTILPQTLKATKSTVEFVNEYIAVLPLDETRAMHARIGETPQWIVGVGDEVRCADNVVASRRD